MELYSLNMLIIQIENENMSTEQFEIIFIYK